jgi:hypothetical protein
MGLNKNQNSGNFNGEVGDMSNYATKSDLETKVTKETNKSLVDNTLIDKLEDLENYDDSLVREEINSINSQLAQNTKNIESVTSYIENELENELENSVGQLTLGVHEDGLLYLFKNGTPQGTGVAMASGEAGDIVGNLDSDNNIILMGALPNGTYMLKYENIDGTYINIGDLVVGTIAPPKPTFTNLAEYNATNTTDFTIWCNDTRIGSDGTSRKLAGYVATNYIEVSNNDVIRIEGLIKEETYPTLAIYDSDKTLIHTPYYLSNMVQNVFIKELTETDTGATFTICTPNCKYIRFSGKPVNGGESVIITKNEEIV